MIHNPVNWKSVVPPDNGVAGNGNWKKRIRDVHILFDFTSVYYGQIRW